MLNLEHVKFFYIASLEMDEKKRLKLITVEAGTRFKDKRKQISGNCRRWKHSKSRDGVNVLRGPLSQAQQDSSVKCKGGSLPANL